MSTKAKWTQRDLVFYESSTQETVAAMSPVVLFDDFLGKEVDATNDWTVAGVNSGTAAINAATGGTMRITTGGADDDDVDVASMLTFKASKGCCVEIRAATNDITGSGFCLGFSDAQGEAADLIAVTYSGTTLTSTASDCALFFHDPDATTDVIRCVAVKADTDGTVTSTGTAAVNGTYHVYRIEINDSGDCAFYFDGGHVYTQSAGITTTAALCVYIGVINRETAVNTFDVDYIKAWQKR